MSNPYTQSHAFPGVGLTLSIGTNASPIVYTAVGEVKNVAGPDVKTETADVTNVQSPNGVKEFKPTLTDPGEFSFTVNLVPDDPGQQDVYSALISKTVLPFQLTYPPASLQGSETTPALIDFSGIVTQCSYDFPLEKEATIAIKIKVSGVPSFVEAH